MALCLSVARPSEQSQPNFYEIAQSATVIIDVPGGWGTGFVIKRRNAAGQVRTFVWTAKHVLEGEPSVAILTFHRDSGHNRVTPKRFPVLRVWRTAGDAALLCIDCPPDAFTSVAFDQRTPALGQPVFICGNHYGTSYDGTITTGVVSQLGVFPNERAGLHWLIADQTTAAVNPGASGAAVFSERTHKVIGMAVGTAGNGLNVYIPTRAFADSDLRWAVDDSLRCPSDYQLRLGPVVELLEKLWHRL